MKPRYLSYSEVGQLGAKAVAAEDTKRRGTIEDVREACGDAEEVLRNYLRVACHNIGAANTIALLLDEAERLQPQGPAIANAAFANLGIPPSGGSSGRN
ncbi:hypothetical protein [Martelella endophytica]|uniref:Uncharacterized protein n=1 Tax=Martelella endophytica TaxID=1486262 RepID=A0A0D5LLN7_MAREN|nr:hypothetical protein [Martelella endophytica]AJY44687.1 hypothetical protein TM49_01705 [Martelella endophytica]